MRPAELLTKLQEAGCRFVIEGNTLRVRGILNDELRSEIREHREEIIRLLGGPGDNARVSSFREGAKRAPKQRQNSGQIEDIDHLKTGAKQEQAGERIERIESEPKKEGGPAQDLPEGRVEFVGNCPVLIVNGVNPLDYRRDPKTGKWIVDPGWWRSISRRGVLRDNAEGEQGEHPAG